MASTYLTRTPSSATNRKTFTISTWLKRGLLANSSTFETIISAIYNTGSGYGDFIRFIDDDTLDIIYFDGVVSYRLTTNRKFRDVNAWYHIVIAFDTTQATDSDRIKLYVNGTQETSFATASYPNLNRDTQYNNTVVHNIGFRNTIGEYFSGSMAHYHFIDGTAYDADTFGETDATTGIWKPKTAPSVTYGNNGFFLKFENSGAFGTDSSGNGNNFTVSGTMTQTIDTPSNVFATLNPSNNYWSNGTLSNGNLTFLSDTSNVTYIPSTLGVSSGKWYWEVEFDAKSGGSDSPVIGITSTQPTAGNQELGNFPNDWGYYGYSPSFYINNNTETSYGSSYTTNDIIGVALDLDNNKLYFSKNGTWQNSGDPTSGATGTGALSITDPSSTPLGFYFPAICYYNVSNTGTFNANFGNGYFGTTAVSSAQNPDDGIGIFEYDVPTGYRALCTKSINAQEYD